MSLFRVLKSTLKFSFKKFPLVWGRSWKVMVPLVVIFKFTEATLERMANVDGYEDVIVLRVMLLLLGLLWTAACVLIIPVYSYDIVKKRPTRLWNHTCVHSNQLIIESLRSFSSALLWSYLLVIPGIVRSIRLYFVPFVVQFDDDYFRGKKDALKESNGIIKGKTWLVIFYLIFLLLLSSPASILGSFFSSLENPIYFGFISLFVLMTEIISNTALLRFYLILKRLRSLNATHV